jgi:hypothetical protein
VAADVAEIEEEAKTTLRLVGRDIDARIGLRVQFVADDNDDEIKGGVGTVCALRDGGKVCDVRWDATGQVRTGISTGLLGDFHLALATVPQRPCVVVGRDVKPAVGQHVRPLTFEDNGGVDGEFGEDVGLGRGLITQVLPEGDVVVRWQTRADERPRGGIYQTGRHGTYFLALIDTNSDRFAPQTRVGRRRPVEEEEEEEATAPAPRGRGGGGGPGAAGDAGLVLGRDVAPRDGQAVFALAGGSMPEMGAGRVVRVDAGGLGVRVRWDNSGAETAALTGRFGVFDLGTLEARQPSLGLFSQ